MSIAFADAVPMCLTCGSAEDEFNVICFSEGGAVFLMSVVGDLIASSWSEVGIALDVCFDVVC